MFTIPAHYVMLAAIHCCQLAIQTAEDTEMSLLFAIHWQFIRQPYDQLAMRESYKTERDYVAGWEKTEVSLLLQQLHNGHICTSCVASTAVKSRIPVFCM